MSIEPNIQTIQVSTIFLSHEKSAYGIKTKRGRQINFTNFEGNLS